VLAVTFETSVLKSHAAARLFCARLIGNNENLAENIRVRTEMSRLKHLIFFTLLDGARACEIRLDEDLSLSLSVSL